MGRTYIVPTGSVALSASATKSLVLVNPTISFLITELGISFDPVATTTGDVVVDLYRTTTIGSPAGSSTTPIKGNGPADSAAQATALTALTTEPTAVEVLRTWFVQPFGGLLVVQFPLGREPSASGTSSNRLGLRVTTPSGVTPNARAYLEIEE